MINSGTRPTKSDRNDFDFFKSKKVLFGAAIPSFPEYYSTDAGLWMPDQTIASPAGTPPYAAQPTGCGNFMMSDLCGDEDGKVVSPDIIDAITHASNSGGADMRTYLKAGIAAIPGHPAYFNVRPAGKIDFFDACRLAMLSTSSEKRGIAIGSPYWLQFGGIGNDGVYPMPDFDLSFASWHAWAVKGWKMVNNVQYLICKMWCGPNYGDKGFGYMSREIFNATMGVRGSAAFTIDKLLPGEKIETVGLAPFVNDIVAYVRNLFNV